MSCLSIKVRRVERLHIRTALVCATGTGEAKYLRVSPDEVQWIYPQVVAYNVESNTAWEVG